MSLKEKIAQKLAEVKSIDLAKRHLLSLRRKFETHEKRLQAILILLDRKLFDIEELEKLKVKSLFSRVLLDKQSQLEENRQEYLEFFLEYKEARKQLELIKYEENILKTKILREAQTKKELEYLLQLREKEIISAPNVLRTKVLEVQVKIDVKVMLKREIYEALIAGAKVKSHMQILMTYLEKAAKLRHFTFELSKTNMIPKEKNFVDLALQEYYKLIPAVKSYEEELQDVFKNKKLPIHSGLSNFKRFSKVYYNNLINDWVVYERINQTLKNMIAVEAAIIESIESLEKFKIENEKEIAKYEEMKSAWLKG